MRFHGRRVVHRHDLQAEIGGGLGEVACRRVPDDEGAAIELPPRRVERLLSRLERRILERVAQRGQRDVGVVVHQIDRSGTRDAARGTDRPGHLLDRRVEHFHVGDADSLDVEQLGKRPAGVVVRRLLRIVGAPILIVHQRIGDAAVRLIHANDERPGRKVRATGGGVFRSRPSACPSCRSCPSRLSCSCSLSCPCCPFCPALDPPTRLTHSTNHPAHLTLPYWSCSDARDRACPEP